MIFEKLIKKFKIYVKKSFFFLFLFKLSGEEKCKCVERRVFDVEKCLCYIMEKI